MKGKMTYSGKGSVVKNAKSGSGSAKASVGKSPNGTGKSTKFKGTY